MPEGLATQANVSIVQESAEAIFGPPPAGINHYYTNTAELATFITNGSSSAISYTPSFTYMGFRYVQLTGYPGAPEFSTLTAHFINQNYDKTGSIGFSDPNLDEVQHMTQAAAQSNFQEIPTDCPQRERRGWLGDAQLSSVTNIYNFDMASSYTSFLQAITDALDPADGADPDCVPWYGHGGMPADPSWGSAYTILAYEMYQYYGDTRIIENLWTGLQAHAGNIQADCNYNMTLFCTSTVYGDWCPPLAGCQVGSGLVSAFSVIIQMQMMSEMASIIGQTAASTTYAAIAADFLSQFNNHWYDPINKVYFDNQTIGGSDLTLQTAVALALTLGVVPAEDIEAVVANLVNDITVTHSGHLNTGIVGIRFGHEDAYF